MEMMQAVPCKFDRHCKRLECYFFHPRGRQIDELGPQGGAPVVMLSGPPPPPLAAAASSAPRAPTSGHMHRGAALHRGEPRNGAGMHFQGPPPCRYRFNCRRSGCRFSHPPQRTCRYGDECTRGDCIFSHPDGRKKEEKIDILSNIPYIADNLKNSEAEGYASAGILAFRKVDGKISLLMGKERRKKEGMCANFLGGKRDKNDNDAQDTAAREFSEECGQLFSVSAEELSQRLRNDGKGCPAMWMRQGRYALFLYELTYDLDIDERFNAMRASKTDKPKRFSEMDSLHWVNVEHFLMSCAQTHKRVKITSEKNYTMTLYSFARLFANQECFIQFFSELNEQAN